MANLQVKNVPEALYREIRRRARQEGRTIRDVVLEAVQTKLGRDELYARLRRRKPIELGRRVVATLNEVRNERDREIG